MPKEAKYRFYQEVTVHSDEAEIDGKTGVILAMGCDEDGEWGYTVMIDEYCWDCPESELTATGRQFKREDFYDDNVSLRVNQKGEIVEPNKYMKNWGFGLIIIALLILSFASYYNQALEIKLLRHQNIVNIMQIIKPGYSKEQTEEILLKAKSSNFKLEKINQDEWILSTPLEFGATNWLLLIDFRNDKVSSLKVRTSDSMNIKPDSAPNDIGSAIQ